MKRKCFKTVIFLKAIVVDRTAKATAEKATVPTRKLKN